MNDTYLSVSCNFAMLPIEMSGSTLSDHEARHCDVFDWPSLCETSHCNSKQPVPFIHYSKILLFRCTVVTRKSDNSLQQ